MISIERQKKREFRSTLEFDFEDKGKVYQLKQKQPFSHRKKNIAHKFGQSKTNTYKQLLLISKKIRETAQSNLRKRNKRFTSQSSFSPL